METRIIRIMPPYYYASIPTLSTCSILAVHDGPLACRWGLPWRQIASAEGPRVGDTLAASTWLSGQGGDSIFLASRQSARRFHWSLRLNNLYKAKILVWEQTVMMPLSLIASHVAAPSTRASRCELTPAWQAPAAHAGAPTVRWSHPLAMPAARGCRRFRGVPDAIDRESRDRRLCIPASHPPSDPWRLHA